MEKFQGSFFSYVLDHLSVFLKNIFSACYPWSFFLIPIQSLEISTQCHSVDMFAGHTIPIFLNDSHPLNH